jgi:uncharacterized protein YcbX
MRLAAIWRYPVKAMLGEPLDAVRVGNGGLVGDRARVVVEGATGRRIANKRGLTDARDVECHVEPDIRV